MWNKIDAETKLGGFFGLIAFIAILVEMSALNFSAEAVSGGIKDMAATLVAIMVLVVAVRKLRPRKETETFHSTLEKGMERMCQKYEPLLNRGLTDENSDINTQNKLEKIYRYNLLTQFDLLLKTDKSDDELIEQGSKVNKGTSTGVFVDFGKQQPKRAIFYIKKSMFEKMAVKSGQDFEKAQAQLGSDFSACINARFSEFCKAKRSSDGISVIFNKETGLDTIEDAKMLLELIEFVLFLYSIRYN